MTADGPPTSSPEGGASPAPSVVVAPPPPWVRAASAEGLLPPRSGDAATCLLFDQQIEAELHQTFSRSVLRLETMLGVQQFSQWRLEFEPACQRVQLHWVNIRRGEQVFPQLAAERIRWLQRESGLEGMVLDGWFTLLLVLEDVRPGDVLDTAYTVEHHPRLLPEHCQWWFQPPAGFRTARYHFAAHFAPNRALQWRTSEPVLAPEETTSPERTHWTWSGADAGDVQPEPHTPSWHLAGPWVQVSDCVNWATVAAAVTAAWPPPAADATLDELAAEITRAEPEPVRRIGRALQWVQDEHRYLSVNFELGGQIPATPGDVCRRRYGDCKDLSFLLVHLLRQLGIEARAVLVDSRVRQSVANLLPSLRFNHVVVEFKSDGLKYWVDATARSQGGGALDRAITHYGFGLPVDANATALIEQPRAFDLRDRFELRESFLIDTTGEASVVAVHVVAHGAQADRLRRRFESTPLEELAKESLRQATERYTRAARLGALQFRDDRVANEFRTAESFEINHFLALAREPGKCVFTLPPSLAATALPVPGTEPRRAPLELPETGSITHVVEIEFPTLQPAASPRLRIEDDFIEFNRRHKSLHAFLGVTHELILRADHVPAEQVAAYRDTVESIQRESHLALTLPVGYARVRTPRDFGELPAAPPAPYTPPAVPSEGTLAPLSATDAPGVSAAPPRVSELDGEAIQYPRRRRRTKMKRGEPVWPVLVIIGLILVVFVLLVLFR